MKIPPGTGNIGPDQEPVPGEDDHIDHADLALLSDLLDVYNVAGPDAGDPARRHPVRPRGA